jgi:hypothetical protein
LSWRPTRTRGAAGPYPRSVNQYRPAAWRPAHDGNYTNANRKEAIIDLIVVHVAQGSYSGTVNWFQDRRASSSAHYVVSRKGRVAQCVRNEDIAWHAGWWKTNKKSIGIEHAGYIGNPRSFSGPMYRSSASSPPTCLGGSTSPSKHSTSSATNRCRDAPAGRRGVLPHGPRQALELGQVPSPGETLQIGQSEQSR